jgi:carboxylesterase type B
MGDYWFAFAATGVPTTPGREPWPLYDQAHPQQMVFDRPTSAVEDCPDQAGLNIMGRRAQRLTEELAPSSHADAV